jgi:hypothetical protein
MDGAPGNGQTKRRNNKVHLLPKKGQTPNP